MLMLLEKICFGVIDDKDLKKRQEVSETIKKSYDKGLIPREYLIELPNGEYQTFVEIKKPSGKVIKYRGKFG